MYAYFSVIILWRGRDRHLWQRVLVIMRSLKGSYNKFVPDDLNTRRYIGLHTNNMFYMFNIGIKFYSVTTQCPTLLNVLLEIPNDIIMNKYLYIRIGYSKTKKERVHYL